MPHYSMMTQSIFFWFIHQVLNFSALLVSSILGIRCKLTSLARETTITMMMKMLDVLPWDTVRLYIH